MIARARRPPAWTAALALLCCACVDLPEFARPSLVDRPRVLALVAEPPEVNPGEQVALSLVVAGAERYDVSWRACGAFDGLFGEGAQYGADQDDEGCGGGFELELGEGETAVLPGAATQMLFASLELAEDVLGGALPEDTIDHIRQSVGLPFTVEARVQFDGKLIRAVKRVLISEREQPNQNPPPPAFTINGMEVSAAAQAFECTTADGSKVDVPAGVDIELAPSVAAGEVEPWLEQYSVIDMRGDLHTREEKAFYSWFGTGGELLEGVTESPLRNEIWRTPEAPGCHSLWVVVRDAHGGASACRTDVTVGGEICD